MATKSKLPPFTDVRSAFQVLNDMAQEATGKSLGDLTLEKFEKWWEDRRHRQELGKALAEAIPHEYHVLGVLPSCTEGVLRAAWRARATETHPDRHPGGDQAFKEVSAAYQLICEHRGLKP